MKEFYDNLENLVSSIGLNSAYIEKHYPDYVGDFRSFLLELSVKNPRVFQIILEFNALSDFLSSGEHKLF